MSLVVVIAVALLVGGLLGWFYSGFGLPSLSSLNEYKAAQNSKVFAADGTLLTELHGDQNRELIALERIPEALRKAVIAVEDSDFYKHKGINWKSIVRALWANVVRGTVVQGGSTITQQYVKNAYVGPKRTLLRKAEEANLAYQLEKKYSKDKILELYLNDIYFGQGCYGIYTAAKKYFGKSPPELTLAECAMLAGIIKSPSLYDPYKVPQAVMERRNLVLRKMNEQGYIKRAEAGAAMREPMVLMPPNKVYVPPAAPYFCDYITQFVRKTYGDQRAFRGGLRIYTTIDLRLQGMAERVLLRELKPDRGPDAAIACIDPKTGYIKAMVGGKNFYLSQFNVAAKGGRQPGSAFKVFVLARALTDGVSTEQSYDASSPRIIPLPDGQKWTVRNCDGQGSGHTSIKSATIHSINVVFAQLIMDVGPPRVADMAKQMGIMSQVDVNPAIALGGLSVGVTPLEMASAYGTLANNGLHAVPRSIYKVTDSEGNVITENKPETQSILDPKVVATMNDILQQVVSSGTGRGANIGRPQAGKTGTTEDHADAWFVGYTPDLVAAVWVGYPQGRVSMGGMCGGDLPASLWREYMGQALKSTPPTPFLKPGEVDRSTNTNDTRDQRQQQGETISVKICDDSGLLATPGCPSTHSQEFRRGEEPTSFCNIHKAPAGNKVPNVIGLSRSAAKDALEQAGYSVTVVQASGSQQASGIVVAQTPAAGTDYLSGGSVTITVSAGAAQSTVPSVVGVSEAVAKARLVAAGFQASVTYAPGQGQAVTGQSPGAGTKMPAGSTVSITVSRGY